MTRNNIGDDTTRHYIVVPAMKMIPENKHLHPQFKVDDRVRILRKVKSFARGWDNYWIEAMDAAVGQIGVVTFISTVMAHDVKVSIPGTGCSYGYPDFVLKHTRAKK